MKSDLGRDSSVPLREDTYTITPSSRLCLYLPAQQRHCYLKTQLVIDRQTKSETGDSEALETGLAETRLRKEGSFSQWACCPRPWLVTRNRLDSFLLNAKFMGGNSSLSAEEAITKPCPTAWNHGCFSQNQGICISVFLDSVFLLKRGDGNASFSWNPNISISYLVSIVV